MEDELREHRHGSGLKFIIGLLIGLAIGYFIGINGYIRVEKDAQPTTQEEEWTDEEEEEEEDADLTGNDPNAVTLVSYSHDWPDREAQISVKNNTKSTITSISGRMIYYNMNGTMLDYRDFHMPIIIAPGMAKRFELEGYNHEEDYAYYKSEAVSTDKNKKYKVKFELYTYSYY